MRALRPRNRGDDGAVAVEFALIVPVLLMVVFGIITFGIVFAAILGVNNAARQGARFGVVDQRTCEDVAGEVQAALQGTLGVDWTDVSMDVTRAGVDRCTNVSIPRTGSVTASTTLVCGDANTSTDELVVTVKTTTKLLIPLVVVNDDFPVEGQGVFRCEYS